MNILALRPQDLEAINTAVAKARAHPVAWEKLKHMAMGDDSPYYRLSDRKPGAPRRPQSENVELPLGFRLAISFEYQPSGLCQHISISSGLGATIPNEHALAMLAVAAGMTWPPPAGRSRIWIEDFVAGPMVGKAINLVEIVELAQ